MNRNIYDDFWSERINRLGLLQQTRWRDMVWSVESWVSWEKWKGVKCSLLHITKHEEDLMKLSSSRTKINLKQYSMIHKEIVELFFLPLWSGGQRYMWIQKTLDKFMDDQFPVGGTNLLIQQVHNCELLESFCAYNGTDLSLWRFLEYLSSCNSVLFWIWYLATGTFVVIPNSYSYVFLCAPTMKPDGLSSFMLPRITFCLQYWNISFCS